MKRRFWSMMLFLLAFGWLGFGVLAQEIKIVEESQEVHGLSIPMKQPKVRPEYLDAFQKRKSNAELLNEYNQLMVLYREREAIATGNDPKEARKAEERLKRINSRIDRGRRSLFRVAKKMRRPLDKEYEQISKKYNDFEEKAAKARDRGQEKMEMKYSQEAAKIAQSVESKRSAIEMINYHLFFDEFEKQEEAAPEAKKGK